MDIEANQQQQPKQSRSRNRWTPALDKLFADLVVKQIQLGNRQNNVFDRKAWNAIKEDFNGQTGLNYNNNQLRKHLDVLRHRYNALKVKSSNVQNQFVIEENVLGLDLWEEFGVQQPRSEQQPAKVKESPIYTQLCTIFADDSGIGKYAQSSHYEGLEECPTTNPISDLFTSPTEETMPSLENLSTPNVERKRKREPDPTGIDLAEMETMASALTDMLTCLRSRTADVTTEDDRCSISKCINALEEIDKNVDESVYFAALELFENPGLRETFMSLKANHLRLTWLQVKCRKMLSPPSVVQLD